jgi:hypothetical protein
LQILRRENHSSLAFRKKIGETNNGAQEVRRSPQARGCGFGEHSLREEQTCFLWLLSLHAAKKVTRSPQASESLAFQTLNKGKELDSRVRGNDKLESRAKSLDSGFRRNDAHRRRQSAPNPPSAIIPPS